MIRSFGDRNTEELFRTERNRRFAFIARPALRKLIQLNQARALGDLAANPGNHLEALLGESIRLPLEHRISRSRAP